MADEEPALGLEVMPAPDAVLVLVLVVFGFGAALVGFSVPDTTSVVVDGER